MSQLRPCSRAEKIEDSRFRGERLFSTSPRETRSHAQPIADPRVDTGKRVCHDVAGQSADDWGFVAGKKFAVAPGDCKHLAKGRPFSKALVKDLDSEVLTREGSQARAKPIAGSVPRKSAGKTGWMVKAACEELGNVSQENVAIVANADGSLVVTSEDVFGPPLTFQLCK